MRLTKATIVLAMAFALTFALTACGGSGGSGSKSDESSQSSAASQSADASSDSQEATDAVFKGKGLVSTFVGENVTDAVVTNEDEAQAAAESLIKRMGGDETTDLVLVNELATETGNTYYIFRQEAGGIMVYGASAKLIVNEGGKVMGLVSAILPDVKLPSLGETAVSQEQAEKTVVDVLAETACLAPRP